jgi:hypothetical protein
MLVQKQSRREPPGPRPSDGNVIDLEDKGNDRWE